MNSRSSQPLIWTFVALLTAALFASALKWGRITIDLPETLIKQTKFIELSFIEFHEPVPEPATEPQLAPEPVIQPEPEATSPPKAEPSPPHQPKVDPTIVKKEREAKEAHEREQTRQREIARKRIEEKRRQKLAAKKVESARRKAAADRAAAKKQTVSKPSGISQPKPKYPSAARRAGQQGTVTLSFTVGSSGKVTSIRITKSSGHALLDNAALAAIRRWRFKPARNALGEAVSYSYTLPVPFRLR
ncbi:MAG: energy transducer TonB [Akkermansiaceae bacterium]